MSASALRIAYTKLIDFNEPANGEGTRCGMALEQSRETSLAGLQRYSKGQSKLIRGYYSEMI